MTNSLADSLLHPIRFRMLRVLNQHTLTPRQLSEHLPDVPPATLYRHLRQLVQAGLVQVTGERPVRGTLEKLYTASQPPLIGPAEANAMSAEAHARAFTQFVVGLAQDFERYLAGGPPDFTRDGVGYRQTILHLSDEEFAQMTQALQQALTPFVRLSPATHRRARALTTIVMPLTDPPPVSRETSPTDHSPLTTDH